MIGMREPPSEASARTRCAECGMPIPDQPEEATPDMLLCDGCEAGEASESLSFETPEGCCRPIPQSRD
jgi:hypothetical protein